jgi:SAM-dependent methyltransferase
VDATQATLWNGGAGNAWVDKRELLDQLFRPFADLLVEAAAGERRSAVLDVGCGTGGVTRAIARALGSRCVGVDVSEPMIDAARAEAEREGTPATFVHADAQRHTFEPGAFDLVVSRFGVMFFDDPVRAFTNLRDAAREGAGLRCVVWRSPEENPFMTTAERAARPLLPDLPARDPDAPGQFAFADADRVRGILERSGWRGVDLHPIDAPCVLPERELVPYFTRMGPLGRVIQDLDEQTRAGIIDAVRAAFDPFVHGSEVRFTAACWLVSGTRD